MVVRLDGGDGGWSYAQAEAVEAIFG